ncbi:hypothetical protein EKO27_g672 [Xylaria grammica]|uniref:FHA domain-containing protein n=1 Tax=Xylaria grammica TaxID=363999 RepID=A0A439DJ77_9PEZI|nr:hypothetical protein EKO27_g672 [Xylaria grammica]
MPTDHAKTLFNNVRVPASAVLGSFDNGLAIARTFTYEDRIRRRTVLATVPTSATRDTGPAGPLAATKLTAGREPQDIALEIGLETNLQIEGAIGGRGLPMIHIGAGRALEIVGRKKRGNTGDKDHATTTDIATGATTTVGQKTTAVAPATKTIADSFALTNGEEPPKPKEKPNYGNSGALAAASNSVTQADGSTIVLKYHEPPEARKPSPKDQWKLFVFKGEDIIDTIPLSNRSCWLVGRDMAVVDMSAEHPSVSKQHAVIQFRYIEKRNEYGDKLGKVKPYLIDLESANGTSLNSKKVPQSRYLELREKDMIQFGQSTREYVLMLAPKD